LELPMLLHPVHDHAHIPLPNWIKVQSLDEVQTEGQSQVSAARIAKLQAARNPHQTATIVYIPDEDGKPQGAMLTHENLSANAIAAFSGIADLQWGEKEVVLNFLPLNHVLARCMIYGHIYYGHSIYFSNPNRVMKHLQEVRPTILTVVPLFLEKLYSKILEKGKKLHLAGRLLFHWALKLAQRYELGKSPWGFYALQLKLANRFVFSQWRSLFGGRLKHIICGGAPLKAELANVYGSAVTPILYGYGLTQASAVICYNRGSLNRAGTVGTPIAGAEVAIAPDGEVLLRGPFLTQGFYKNLAATRELIDNQGWLHTGDLGSFTPEGFLQITGLKKALFKLSTGKYIAPKPIEQRLTQSPLIAQAIVVGAEQKFCSVLIVPNLPALHRYALEIGIDLPANDLLQHPYIAVLYRTLVDNANCHLPYWASVKHFRLINTPLTVENGLLTPTGQINRTQAIQQFAGEIAALYGEEPRRDSAPPLPDSLFPPVPETACPTYARSLNPRLTTLWLLVIGHWSLVIGQ
jgi:long-chain acyl-CoA synthetase